MAEQRRAARRTRRRARYDQVVALRAAGMSQRAIARTVGLDRHRLAADQFPERAPQARRRRQLDRFAPYILARYDAGLDNSAQLARELRARGYHGSVMTVRRYLTEVRHTRRRGVGLTRASPGRAATCIPSPRATAWLFRKIEDTRTRAGLTPAERAYVEAVCTRSVSGHFK